MHESNQSRIWDIRLLALVAILGFSFVVTGLTMGSIGNIVQAIGLALVSISFIWIALVEKGINPNVRASLIIGLIILIIMFMLMTLATPRYYIY